jgi:hypothetical protein
MLPNWSDTTSSVDPNSILQSISMRPSPSLCYPNSRDQLSRKELNLYSHHKLDIRHPSSWLYTTTVHIRLTNNTHTLYKTHHGNHSHMVAPMFPWHVALEGGGHPYLYLYMIIRVLPCGNIAHSS